MGPVQSGRSRGVELDGSKDLKWTVQRVKILRSEVMNLDGLKG